MGDHRLGNLWLRLDFRRVLPKSELHSGGSPIQYLYAIALDVVGIRRSLLRWRGRDASTCGEVYRDSEIPPTEELNAPSGAF